MLHLHCVYYGAWKALAGYDSTSAAIYGFITIFWNFERNFLSLGLYDIYLSCLRRVTFHYPAIIEALLCSKLLTRLLLADSTGPP